MRISDWSSDVCSSDLLALNNDRLCSIGEISRTYDVSHNHLMKVVNALAHDGFIETVRGRAGGMRLARPAKDISVGEVVRRTEEGFQLADCSSCALSPACGLTGVLAERMRAMMAVFDRSEEHTSELQSIMRNSYAVFCLKKKTT